MKSTGSAVSGLDDSRLEMCEKSTIQLDAKEGCYATASPLAMIRLGPTRRAVAFSADVFPDRNHFLVSNSSKRSIAV